MLAVGMIRGKPGIHAFELPMPEIKQPDEVLVLPPLRWNLFLICHAAAFTL